MFAICHAIDVAAKAAANDDAANDAAANDDDVFGIRAANAAYAAYDAAKAAANAAANAYDAAYAAYDAANAAANAANAADAANAAYDAAYDAAKAAANAADAVFDAAYDAANAANADAAYDAANAANADTAYAFALAASIANKRAIFNEIIINDIRTIKADKSHVFNWDISVYGEAWDNFQVDLIEVGCGYWAKLYANVFENGFAIDESFISELQRRLSVPDEIKEQGAAEVGKYLERLGEGAEKINEARIIILGEKGSGKTSLARRLHDTNAPMPKEYESTEGVITSIWKFPDKNGIKDMDAHIWDFAGHSITHSAHRCFMSARCLYIYVYNGREERDNNPAYWLEQIRIHGGDSPVLFLVNERDDNKADIAEKTLKKDYPSIAGYHRVDIGSDDKAKLEEFRQTVMEMVRDNPSWNSQQISAEAYRIKNELRERFDTTNSPHITRKEFNEIASKNNMAGAHIEEILKDLHALGVCLWYDKDEMEEFNTLVLNPDWITNGIYRIINKRFNDKKYILTVADGVEILKSDERYEYPAEKVKYLFRLMRVYEARYLTRSNCGAREPC